MTSIEKRKFEVYEHLEHYVRQTSYAQRLQWLEQANEFVRSIRRKRSAKKSSR